MLSVILNSEKCCAFDIGGDSKFQRYCLLLVFALYVFILTRNNLANPHLHNFSSIN